MNVSDIIERFLLDAFGNEPTVNFNRNELAAYFAVAPSQINYVLGTRFTPDRGLVIESRRGGGGSIKIIRISGADTDDVLMRYIEETLTDGIEFTKACQIIDRLCDEDVYTETEASLIKAAITDKALLAPTVAKGRLRGSILKSVLLETLKQKSDDVTE